MARPLAPEQFDGGFWAFERLGEEADQFLIGGRIDRRCRDMDADFTVDNPVYLISVGARLNPDGESDSSGNIVCKIGGSHIW